jgi:hypothetical protein
MTASSRVGPTLGMSRCRGRLCGVVGRLARLTSKRNDAEDAVKVGWQLRREARQNGRGRGKFDGKSKASSRWIEQRTHLAKMQCRGRVGGGKHGHEDATTRRRVDEF